MKMSIMPQINKHCIAFKRLPSLELELVTVINDFVSIKFNFTTIKEKITDTAIKGITLKYPFNS